MNGCYKFEETIAQTFHDPKYISHKQKNISKQDILKCSHLNNEN